MKVYVVTECDRYHNEYVIAVYQSEREANDFTNDKWLENGGVLGKQKWCVEEFDLIECTQTPGK